MENDLCHQVIFVLQLVRILLGFVSLDFMLALLITDLHTSFSASTPYSSYFLLTKLFHFLKQVFSIISSIIGLPP